MGMIVPCQAHVATCLGRNSVAAAAYREAVRLATNDVERNYLTRRLAEVSSARGGIM